MTNYRKPRRKKWRRPGALYEFTGWDPRALLKYELRTIVLYDGQTRQRPENRWKQHQLGSPSSPPKAWWPLVTEKRVVWRRVKVTKWWLDIKEYRLIRKHKPAANILLNFANRKRIPPWEMEALMSRIEAAGGVAALVSRAKARRRSSVGWSISEDGSKVEWYGDDAGESRWEQWRSQLTGSSSC